MMKRFYTNNGTGISTKLSSIIDGKKYVISTAENPMGGWQLAVFKVLWEIPFIYVKVNIHDPLRVISTRTFDEAKKKHFDTEDLVINAPIESWQNWG